MHPLGTAVEPYDPSASAPAAVEVVDLRRRYGSFEAVRGISFTVRAGEVLALLGVNGAGKTSALEVVEGLAPAHGGTVRTLGHDPLRERAAVRRHMGVVLQSAGLRADLTVRETLSMWGRTVTDPQPIDAALAQVHLADRAAVRTGSLSAGERRRLDVALALLGRPRVVVLDVLTDVVRTVRRGGRYVDPQLAAEAISAGDSPLTPREADVLELAAGGAPVEEIAARATCRRAPSATTSPPPRPS